MIFREKTKGAFLHRFTKKEPLLFCDSFDGFI